MTGRLESWRLRQGGFGRFVFVVGGVDAFRSNLQWRMLTIVGWVFRLLQCDIRGCSRLRLKGNTSNIRSSIFGSGVVIKTWAQTVSGGGM